MINYFFLSGTNPKKSVSAFGGIKGQTSNDITDLLDGKNEFPFELHLVKLTIEKNGITESDDLSDVDNIWEDYMGNKFAFPMFSEKMTTLVKEYLTGHEYIDWISCKINHLNEQRIYFIPRFNESLDVLDIEKTKFLPNRDIVLRPVFSYKKIKDLTMFTKPAAMGHFWKITSGIYISETLKKAMQKEKITGVTFEKTRVE